MPGVRGRRALATRLLHWYGRQVAELCGEDADVQQRALRVVFLDRQVSSLLHPTILFKVVRRAFGARRRRLFPK